MCFGANQLVHRIKVIRVMSLKATLYPGKKVVAHEEEEDKMCSLACIAFYCPIIHAMDKHKQTSTLLGACGRKTEELNSAISAADNALGALTLSRGSWPWRDSRRTACASLSKSYCCEKSMQGNVLLLGVGPVCTTRYPSLATGPWSSGAKLACSTRI